MLPASGLYSGAGESLTTQDRLAFSLSFTSKTETPQFSLQRKFQCYHPDD